MKEFIKLNSRALVHESNFHSKFWQTQTTETPANVYPESLGVNQWNPSKIQNIWKFVTSKTTQKRKKKKEEKILFPFVITCLIRVIEGNSSLIHNKYNVDFFFYVRRKIMFPSKRHTQAILNIIYVKWGYSILQLNILTVACHAL